MANDSESKQSLAQHLPRPHAWLSHILAPGGIESAERLRKAVNGKNVLVTGASFGIGEALALRLGGAGANLMIAARSTPQLDSLAERIARAGGQVKVFTLDLADSTQIAKTAAEIDCVSGGMDVVVHNAGKSIRRSLALSVDRFHDFQRLMAVNYLGPVQLQLALLPKMQERGSGQIVNVSSVGVRLPPAPRWAAYLASKSAFDIWLRSAAPELKHQGIVCTSIYFGLVHTRMSAPTPAYRTMPGQTADEAATVICRALIQRSTRIGPWWLRPAEWLSAPLAQPIECLQGRLFLSGSDTAAARGKVHE